MPTCPTCFHKLGYTRDHGDSPCTVRQSLLCTQCSCYGHERDTCDQVTHVWRPGTYEEIIRSLGGQYILDRWGLDTETQIVYHSPKYRPLTLEDQEREIAETNTIEIRYLKGRQDKQIRAIMDHLKLKTEHAMKDNLTRLRWWAISKGKKLRLVQEK